jgi:hypothetical protein
MSTVTPRTESDIRQQMSLPDWLALGLIGALTLGAGMEFFTVAGEPFTAYSINPFLFIVAVLTVIVFGPRITLPKPALRYLLLVTVLLVTTATAGGGDVHIAIARHATALAGAVAMTLLATAVPFHRFAVLFALASLTISSIDLMAFLGFVPVANGAAATIPIGYGGIGLPMLFGTHGIVLAVGSTMAAYTAWRVEWPLPWIAILGLNTAMAVASQSRSSIIAAVVGVGTVSAYVISRRVGVEPSRILLLILPTGVGATVVLAAARPQTILTRLIQAQRGAEVLASEPITGIGWGTFVPQYASSSIHFSPLIYFVVGGVPLGFVYLVLVGYALATGTRVVLSEVADCRSYAVLGAFLAVLVEVSLYPNTPNVHLIVLGALLMSLPSYVHRGGANGAG